VTAWERYVLLIFLLLFGNIFNFNGFSNFKSLTMKNFTKKINFFGSADTRNRDLLHAKQTLYQLSYRPKSTAGVIFANNIFQHGTLVKMEQWEVRMNKTVIFLYGPFFIWWRQ
jgi:hypothetical protein